MNSNTFLKAIAFLACAAFTGAAQAQASRVLVGYPPGGTLDQLARIVAEQLSPVLNRPVVVENRTGALGQVAASELKKSPPDGNTVLVISDSGLTLYPHTVAVPAYDTLKDFVPVAHLGSYHSAIAVGPNVPAKDLASWVKWVKSDAKNATYGTAGAGSNQHFMGFMLGQAIGVPLTHVPYRGVQPTVADLLGGQVPTVLLPTAQLLPHAKTGRIEILAHSGGRRASDLPNVPTFKELGYPALEVQGWYLLVAPAGTSAEIVSRYHGVMTQAMRTPAVRERMTRLDLEIQDMSPAEMVGRLKADYDRWKPIVAASGFRGDK